MLGNPERNVTRARENVDIKQTDYEYLLSLLEREVLATPTNRALHALGDDASPFKSNFLPSEGIDVLKVEPEILHEMMFVRE